MDFQDKSLQCSDCGATFTFSAGEQELFHSRGFTNEPRRCTTCRQARKQSQGNDSRGGSSQFSPRRMFPATCGQCGKATEVPFEPRGHKPVYCSDCYRKINPSR